MRFHLLFPLAFLSGIHGFALFTPYLLVVATAGIAASRRRRRRAEATAQREMTGKPGFDAAVGGVVVA